MSTSTVDVQSRPLAAPADERPSVVNDFALVVDFPGQFEGFRRRHARYALAEQSDDLLIGMTIAIVHDDARFQSIASAG